MEYTYTFNIAGKGTPNEVFQARQFIRNFDDIQCLIGLCLPRFNGCLTGEDVFPVIGYQENGFNMLEKIY